MADITINVTAPAPIAANFPAPVQQPIFLNPGTVGAGAVNSGFEFVYRPAAVAMGGHRVVCFDPLFEFIYASNDNPAHVGAAVGVTTGAANAGSIATAQTMGALTESSWAWVPRLPVYLGTNGLLTQSVPTIAGGAAFLQQIGVPVSATELLINIQLPIRL